MILLKTGTFFRLFSFFLFLSSVASAQDFFPKFSEDDIDFSSCRVIKDGKEIKFTEADVKAALGYGGQGMLTTGGERVNWGHPAKGTFIIAFKKELAIGTLIFNGSNECKILKNSFKGNPAKAPEDQWQQIEMVTSARDMLRLATAVPGTKSKAVKLTITVQHGDPPALYILRHSLDRIANLALSSIANAESEYTLKPDLGAPHTFAASDIPRGKGKWINTGAKKGERIPRGPVSDVDPSWFILSWLKPQKLSSIFVHDNSREIEIYRFAGADGVNPAVGTKNEWKKVRGWKSSEVNFGGDRGPKGRLVTFAEPVDTRGLKYVILKTGDANNPVTWIDSFHVYKKLKTDEALPAVPAEKDHPPFSVPFEFEKEGIVSVVVEDSQGKRVSNILGRADRPAGKNSEYWDLKDQNGEYVKPGKYKITALTMPPLEAKYEMSPYPNVESNSPGNSPWRNGHSGKGGWLADHTPPGCVTILGDKIYFGASTCESGEALIECDLTGRRLWGHGNYMAWTGPTYLASGQGHIFVCAPGNPDRIWAVDQKTKKSRLVLEAPSNDKRKRRIQGIAVNDGKLYASINADDSWIKSATSGNIVDIVNCLPKYKEAKEDGAAPADPRGDFIRLFRLAGTPPGRGEGLTYLESTDYPGHNQHIMLTFKKPVPVGTLLFPQPKGDFQMRISILKPNSAYPPSPELKNDWHEIYRSKKGTPWMAVTAPKGTMTRAICITFNNSLDDLAELIDDDGGEELLGEKTVEKKVANWKVQLEGMKILRRRYKGLTDGLKIKVNSGAVNAQGEWDAQRKNAISANKPGIYTMEWDKKQKIRGLAIKEIDGKTTEIDVYTGQESGNIDIENDSHWKTVKTYHQSQRYYYIPDVNHNSKARFMDGYVDFGKEIETRAVRLRVVEQWSVRGDRGYGVRSDRGGMDLNPVRCRVYGVLALGYEGGESPVDPMSTSRIEVYGLNNLSVENKDSLKLIDELPLERTPGPPLTRHDLTFTNDGQLLALNGKSVVKINGNKESQVVISDLEWPTSLAVDAKGNIYVFDAALNRKQVRVYSNDGKFLRSIGNQGGYKTGSYDPNGLTPAGRHCSVDLKIDGNDKLWIVEKTYTLKRISRWTLDGKWEKDFLGNTGYGGGGVLDVTDKSRIYYASENATLEFSLDWQSGKSSLKNILWMGNSQSGEEVVKVEDRVYLASRPAFGRQSYGVVFLREGNKLRRVAAVGKSAKFPPLNNPDILEKLGTTPLSTTQFIWSDSSGDGEVQADEVTFSPLTIRDIGRVDTRLGFAGLANHGSQDGATLFKVSGYHTNGAPKYTTEKVKVPPASSVMSFDEDRLFFFNAHKGFNDQIFNGVVDKKENTLWQWETFGAGVHALYSSPPYNESQVVAEFDIIGFGKAVKGDLGEFFVTNSNTGIMHVWTKDGILAGRIFRDLRSNNRRAWSMEECDRRMDLSDITIGQEHFSGWFGQTADGKFYTVVGHNHISVLEVLGLNNAKRVTQTINVTAEDIKSSREWSQSQSAKKVYQSAKVMSCFKVDKPKLIDGSLDDWKVDFVSRHEEEPVRFAMTYDDRYLYLAYSVSQRGPFKNSGEDWKQLYKTGAAVDFLIGTDTTVPFNRKYPEKGDSRLLITKTKEGIQSVLYQPVSPNSAKEDAWEVHTMVARTVFDRVVKTPEVKVAVGGNKNQSDYTVEVAVPLSTLGLKPVEGKRLKFDWGILQSGVNGTEVLQRLYWSNKSTQILSDVAFEAKLEPSQWGYMIFRKKGSTGVKASIAGGLLKEGTEKLTEEDILDELEGE